MENINARLELITRNAVEIVTLDDLKRVLEDVEKPKAYIGFEPSGLVHIGWLIWMYKIRDFVEAGLETYILEATWHAYINDKLGGDMDTIRKAARFVRKVLEALGINVSKIKFVDAEDLISDKTYWELLIKSAKHVSLARVKRALTIMGRKASEAETDFSKLIYPLMQVTDIFYLDLDIALGGTDQRKAHMLARDIAEKIGRKKVVAIHTPLLTSLQGPGKRMEVTISEANIDEVLADVKMSKSKPETAIFIHDPPEAIREKIRKAYCPPREVELNPVIEINKYLLFSQPGFELYVDRPAKYGGPLTIHSYEELEKLYKEGKLHPADLKNATAEALIKMLEPVRKKILEDREARELLETLMHAKITR
ncbi:tyrosine--tRNA ligase [Desulfurococcaceae archaeon MEX13E-LK6-19]|nr:tyrosine--tRNA ligase [Desulfurococcaceae archaeon MEX13E-LK6-19]